MIHHWRTRDRTQASGGQADGALVRRARAIAAVTVVLALGGCAGVPSASTPRVLESVPAGGLVDEPDVRFQPISPQAGESAVTIVKDFLAASESPDPQHRIARQFLTPSAARSWRDDAGAVVLSVRPYVEKQDGGASVTIRTNQVGRVNGAGSYRATSAPYSETFDLERVNGEWRISHLPDGVIVADAAFQDSYRRLNVYFLDRTGARMVPDPRWFSAPRESLPNELLDALLNGPSPALGSAVRTELGPGISLTGNVVPESDGVRVYLSGLGRLGDVARAEACAQIVWTLNQLGGPGVEIYDDGQLVELPDVDAIQHVGDWGKYDPDDLPLTAPGYFVSGGAVWTTEGRRVAGAAGLGTLHAKSVAVSRNLSRLAVVGRVARGETLYIGAAKGILRRSLTARSLTAPTWGPALDEAWTVRDGHQIIQVRSQGSPTAVSAPDLDRVGPVTVLRLSRDGARIAVIAGTPGAQRLYVGAVSRSDRVSVEQLISITPGLANVTDVAWSTGDTLIALTRNSPSDAVLHSVTVDGSAIDTLPTSGLPGPPSAVAAAPKLPTLTVAQDGIWRLRDPQGTWTDVPRGDRPLDMAPVYPG